MTVISIVFPWGRYYAHPWGLNPVRLREAEWPPSPWRLLRALVSCWFRSSPGQALSEDAKGLIERLGRELPDIGFCKIAFGQTVHYQPNYGAAGTDERQDARYKNTRHENHFAAVHGPVFFRWKSVDLSVSQQTLLRELLRNMSYFGRAESVCEAGLMEDAEAINGVGWCLPMNSRRISERCRDVFCPNPHDFRATDLWVRRAEKITQNEGFAPKHFVTRCFRLI